MTRAADGTPPDRPAVPSAPDPAAVSPAAVSPAALLASARCQGLELTTDAAACDESGLDFVVVHARDAAGAPWIVRRPRRPSVLEAARQEARTLALVRERLPVSVPDWRVFSDEVIAYPRLPGIPALVFDPATGPHWNIDPAAPGEPLLTSLAEALAALQAIPIEAAREAGVRVSSLADERAWLRACMQKTREVLAPSQPLWQRWHEWLDADGVWPSGVVPVHGDLHPGHWLLDDAGRLSGILDWTAAQVGDPGSDFGLILGAIGRAGLEGLLEPFRRAGGKTWPALVEHARERWAAFPAIAADFALQTGDAGVLEHARRLLAAAENEAR